MRAFFIQPDLREELLKSQLGRLPKGGGGPLPFGDFQESPAFVTVFAATEEVKWAEAEAQRDAEGEIDASQREKKQKN